MRNSKKHDDNAINRRIDFLLAEARSAPQHFYDQAVQQAMRVISNFCTFGENASSSFAGKIKNPHMSEEALKCLQKLHPKGKVGIKEWNKKTTNEHQEPLIQIWKWIIANHDSLSHQDIIKRFKKSRMVTITRDENKSLENHKDPKKRYKDIEVITLDKEDMKKFFRKRS